MDYYLNLSDSFLFICTKYHCNHKYLASLKPDVLFFNENPNHYRLNIIDRIKYLNTYHNLMQNINKNLNFYKV